jgi:uncharacterized membrane protein HdeD (DUF308 family)
MTTAVLDDLKRVYRLGWWALFLRGLFSLAVGVFVLARPLESVAAFALVIAFWAIFSGLTTTVHAFELKPVAPHWWVLLLSGLVSVGFGVAALDYYPVLSLTYAVVLVAWWLTITGAMGVYAAMQEKRLGLHWGWTAAFAVLSLAAGVFAILVPPVTLATIMGLIAGFAIVSGVALIIGAFKIRSVVHSATAHARAGMAM